MPALSPLLPRNGATKAEWLKQREIIREKWLAVLGGLPERRVPLKSEFSEKENCGDFTRRHVRYAIEEDVFTDGYLLEPKEQKGRLPAIVVFHPTTPLQAQGVAGLSTNYAEEKWQGVQLAKRGHVVWCPRNFIFEEQPKKLSKATDLYVSNVNHMHARHPSWCGMTRMIFDAIRAADFVCSLPNVDTNRIGCIGHSLGGKVALYAPAFDERYKVSVSSEGGIGLKFSNWDAVWYLGERIKQADFERENHEVLSLVAPRAFLLLAGNFADNDKSWAFIEATMPVYKLLGAPENVGWFNHGMGHRYSPEARAVAEEFFDTHLK